MHILVVGNSGSGKTICAKSLADDAASAGHRVIVFDPTMSGGWPVNAIKYADPEAFLDDAPGFRNAYVFIDESADVWAFDEDSANTLIYRGRHRGLLFVIIAQRSRMVRPNARNQCSRVFAFRQQLDDAKTLAAEYHGGLIECASMPMLHGIVSDGFDCKRIKVSFDPNRIQMVPINKPVEAVEPVEDDEPAQNGPELVIDNTDQIAEN